MFKPRKSLNDGPTKWPVHTRRVEIAACGRFGQGGVTVTMEDEGIYISQFGGMSNPKTLRALAATLIEAAEFYES